MLSGKTQAIFIELMDDYYSHTGLDTFFLKMDVGDCANSGGSNKQSRVRNVLECLKEKLDAERVEKAFLNMINELLNKVEEIRNRNPFADPNPEIDAFFEALKQDGWVRHKGRLIPTNVDEVSLAPEIYGLEKDLEELGLKTAYKHYTQVVNNFRDKNYESSNGQLRSFLENLYIELCKNKIGRECEEAQAAIQALQENKILDKGEFNIARGLFEASNERGAHHGLTNEQEATFRFHFSTALARYLIARMR